MKTKTDYNKLTDDQLNRALGEAVAKTHEGLFEACCILTVKKSRGHTHPAFKHPIYRWHEEVSTGKLTVLALLDASDSPALVKALTALPTEEQDRLANEARIDVAYYDDAGEIVEGVRTLASLTSPSMINRVFADGTVRTLKAQKDILRKEGPPVQPTSINRKPQVRADTDTKVLIVGTKRLTLDELAGPLSELGYSLVLTPKKAA